VRYLKHPCAKFSRGHRLFRCRKDISFSVTDVSSRATALAPNYDVMLGRNEDERNRHSYHPVRYVHVDARAE
jgi:hypothetical protein